MGKVEKNEIFNVFPCLGNQGSRQERAKQTAQHSRKQSFLQIKQFISRDSLKHADYSLLYSENRQALKCIQDKKSLWKYCLADLQTVVFLHR